MKSEFWFRDCRVAVYETYEALDKCCFFEFDTNDPKGAANCNMPSWTPADLKLFALWLTNCAIADTNKKPLPPNTELH